MTDRYKQRRKEADTGMLRKIVAENGLVADSFLEQGPDGQNAAHVCADSTAVLPWLLRWWFQLRQAGAAGSTKRNKLVACMTAWLALVQKGLRFMEGVRLLVEAPNGHAVRVGMVDGILEWHELQDFCPGVDYMWAAACDPACFNLGPTEQELVV